MTNAHLQPLYDILGEAYMAGRAQQHATYSTTMDGETAASILFPLAARMEEIVTQQIREAHQLDIGLARLLNLVVDSDYSVGWNAALEKIMDDITTVVRSLPSSPERETL